MEGGRCEEQAHNDQQDVSRVVQQIGILETMQSTEEVPFRKPGSLEGNLLDGDTRSL